MKAGSAPFSARSPRTGALRASWLARLAGGRVSTGPRCPVAGRGTPRVLPGLPLRPTPVDEAAPLPKCLVDPISVESEARRHKLRRCPKPAFPNARVHRAGFVDADGASVISRSSAKRIDRIAAPPAPTLETLSRWGTFPNPLGTSPQGSLVCPFVGRADH